MSMSSEWGESAVVMMGTLSLTSRTVKAMLVFTWSVLEATTSAAWSACIRR
ncbi:MAG: hypothetical protein BWX71_02552 [Deltaproteobacteria bacterium ADurb.Bin072]|nr:MAG: hypothetical protein BWX71_02552 [Deltaproteobacteria bacterium ADurb.Bin072]